MTRPSTLESRFRASLDALGVRGAGAHVLAAVSGGRDSVVLLHLLRFAADDAALRISAAHFDHGMRRGSAGDADWVRGLCRAWGVPLHEGRADAAPGTEEEARDARYAFLRRAQAGAGATHLATAHHADDQAETVLFRALRGTGIDGLAGIPLAGPGGLVRPLLDEPRAALRRHARAHGLAWREDPTNRGLDPARNRLRRQMLPYLERTVAPGARRSLARLAALAREDEAAWNAVLAPLLAEAVHEEDGALVLVRERLAAYDSAIAARLLRVLMRRLGTVPDRTGTRLALEFIIRSQSGRELRLPGGVRVRTEFGHVRLERADRAGPAPPPDRPLLVPADAPGEGRFRVGGVERTARWTEDAPADGAQALRIGTARAAFPLTVRGWRPGDSIRTAAGTRPLKKLFGEARVPAAERRTRPVVAGADGTVLWVPGIASAPACAPAPGERAITLSIL